MSDPHCRGLHRNITCAVYLIRCANSDWWKDVNLFLLKDKRNNYNKKSLQDKISNTGVSKQYLETVYRLYSIGTLNCSTSNDTSK